MRFVRLLLGVFFIVLRLLLLLKHQCVVKAASVRRRAVLLGLTLVLTINRLLAQLDVHEAGTEALGLYGSGAVVTCLRDDGGGKEIVSELILRIANARRRVGLLLLQVQLVADEHDSVGGRLRVGVGILLSGNFETLVEHVHAFSYRRRDRRSGMLHLLHVDIIKLLRVRLNNDLAARVCLGVRASCGRV